MPVLQVAIPRLELLPAPLVQSEHMHNPQPHPLVPIVQLEIMLHQLAQNHVVVVRLDLTQPQDQVLVQPALVVLILWLKLLPAQAVLQIMSLWLETPHAKSVQSALPQLMETPVVA